MNKHSCLLGTDATAQTGWQNTHSPGASLTVRSATDKQQREGLSLKTITGRISFLNLQVPREKESLATEEHGASYNWYNFFWAGAR